MTQSGLLFQKLFQDYLQRFQETLEEARQINRGFRHIVRVGCAQQLELSLLREDSMGHFRTKYPNITLEPVHLNADGLLPALRKEQIDLALLGEAPPDSEPGLTAHLLTLPNGMGRVYMTWLDKGEIGVRNLVVNELSFHFSRMEQEVEREQSLS